MADFCTATELRTYTRTDATTLPDLVALGVIDAATSAIISSVNRTFEVVGSATTRYFTAAYRYQDMTPTAAWLQRLPNPRRERSPAPSIPQALHVRQCTP